MNPEFSIHDVQHQGSHTLALVGELEMTNAPILTTIVATLCTDGATEIILDVGELRLIDSTGLGSILRSRAMCQDYSCGFGLTRGAQRMQRVFELTELDKDFSPQDEHGPGPGQRRQLWPVPTGGDHRPLRQVASPAVRLARLARELGE